MRDFVMFDHFGRFVYGMEGAMESINLPLFSMSSLLIATHQKPEITRRVTLRMVPGRVRQEIIQMEIKQVGDGLVETA